MHFFKTYFDNTQVAFLSLAGFFFILSLYFQTTKRSNYSLVFLGLTAFCVFTFAALLDPFLNIWDERYHALVAKNMLDHPLMPTLYDDPVVDMAYNGWYKSHIWLYKQPLFLWQMALCFKLFGVSEFSLRIPDIVLGTILVLITYRSGKLLVNQRVGYIAGVLTISTLYIIELISGKQELEHNDFIFLVYISLSIWSFIEYYYSKKKRWIYLIGLFSGMAILCKWMVALLVYFGWFLLKILQKETTLKANKDILISLVVTALVALPWQIFTLIRYPAEILKAYKLFALHITIPLEGHSGDFWYHFNFFSSIYGTAAPFLIIPALLVMLKKCNDKKLFYSLLSMVLIVYLFFSLVTTKMPSFPIVVAMMVFIAFATLFDSVLVYIGQYIKNKQIQTILFIVSVFIVVLLRFDIELLQARHTLWKDNQWVRMLSNNKKVLKSLHLPQNSVLFNVNGGHYIEAMFYTGLPAYNFIPSLTQYNDVKNKGRIIAIFISKTTTLPDYLMNDPDVILIDNEIQGYD